MSRLLKNRAAKLKMPPMAIGIGTDSLSQKANGFIMNYTQELIEEIPYSLNEMQKIITAHDEAIQWIHIEGHDDKELIQFLKDKLQISIFQLDDALNTDHDPKMDDDDDILFFLLKTPSLDTYHENGQLIFKHIGLFLGDSYVLSLCDTETSIFNFVKQRIKDKKGRIRGMKQDYLFYSLLHAVIEHYFYIVEELNKKIEELESRILSMDIGEDILPGLNKLKRDFLILQKFALLINDNMQDLDRNKKKLFSQDMEEYIEDLAEKAKQLVMIIQDYRVILSDHFSTYISNIHLQTNKIITLLTLFSSIFIPITFITSLYGMNFKHMPELGFKYGYHAVWLIICVLSVTMIRYFKQNKWI